MALPTPGSGGGVLEDLFHLVVVILITTSNLLRFFRSLQLSAHVAILRTVVRLNTPSHYRSRVVACCRTIQGAAQCDQAAAANRTNAGNLAQQLSRFMSSAAVPTVRNKPASPATGMAGTIVDIVRADDCPRQLLHQVAFFVRAFGRRDEGD